MPLSLKTSEESFFSHTEEQILQRYTETLSQPITQSISANVKGSGPSPNPSPAGKGLGEGVALSHVLLFLSQNYTEEQKSQRRTETLSQPITQNDITEISRKALCYLSSLAGVCGFSL